MFGVGIRMVVRTFEKYGIVRVEYHVREIGVPLYMRGGGGRVLSPGGEIGHTGSPNNFL